MWTCRPSRYCRPAVQCNSGIAGAGNIPSLEEISHMLSFSLSGKDTPTLALRNPGPDLPGERGD